VPFALALLANVRAEVAGVDRFFPKNGGQRAAGGLAEGCTAVALGRRATASGEILIARTRISTRRCSRWRSSSG